LDKLSPVENRPSPAHKKSPKHLREARSQEHHAHMFPSQLKFNKKYGVDRLISQETLEILSGYAWPGNVRQLENVIERLVITTDSIIHPRDLPDLIHQHTKERLPDPPFSSLDEALREVERQMVVRSYQKCGSSRKVAADLNVSQPRASRLIRKYCGHRADSE
jgi:transcriptional regulator with PAS, ATPase and Fis domain